MITLALLLLGCSDYSLKGMGDEDTGDSGTVTVPGGPGGLGEYYGHPDGAEPWHEGLIDPCGLEIIDEYTGEMVSVQSYPVFELMLGSDREWTVTGDKIPLEVGITSFEGCGELQIHHMGFTVFDAEGPAVWIAEATISGKDSALEELHTEDLQDPNSGEATDAELQYSWGDGSYETSHVHMETKTLESSGEFLYAFTFGATEVIPGDRNVVMFMSTLIWTDVTTGNTVVWYVTAEKATWTIVLTRE